MASRSINLEEKLREYLLDVSLREPAVMTGLRTETSKLEASGMQMSPEQAQFMQMLVKLTGTKRILEIGTFTGFSALAMALALPEDGELVACDISEEWTSIGKPFWAEAGVANKIDLRIGPAVDTLEKMVEDPDQHGRFDFAFIDADKNNYGRYYEAALKLVRSGGLITVDNVLWGGRVIDSEAQDEDTQAIRALNAKIHADERVDVSLVPIGDGVTLARKR